MPTQPNHPSLFSQLDPELRAALKKVSVVQQFTITSTSAATTDRVIPFRSRVVDAYAVQTAAGTASDTWKVSKVVAGTASDITAAVDISAAADTDVTRAAKIDDAEWDLAEGDTLRITTAGAPAGLEVFVILAQRD